MNTRFSSSPFWSVALLVAAVFIPAQGMSQTSGGSAKHLRLGFVVSKDSPLGAFGTTLADLVKERTKGAVLVDLFDKGQLGGETEMLNSVRQGSLDLTLVGSPIVAQVEPSFGVTELPFIWKDAATMFKVLNGQTGKDLLNTLETNKLVGIAFADSGPRSVLSRSKPVEGIDDVRGLKIRVVENKLYVASWRGFGANPVPMAWTEVYTGLQQGAIDAVDSTPWGTRDAKHFEVAKYIALTNHIYTAYVLVMNIDHWGTIPAEQQQILISAAMDAQRVNRDLIEKDNKSAIEMMKTAGVKVTQPDRNKFLAKVDPVYAEFAKSINPALLKQVQDANK